MTILLFITLYEYLTKSNFLLVYNKEGGAKNMSFVEIFIVFIIIVILAMYISNNMNAEVEYVRSRVDQRTYLVLSLHDKQEAADYLAGINKDLIRITKHLMAKYPDDENYKRLYNNFDPSQVSEGSPQSSYTSYSINKSQLVICIRQTDNKFVRKNIVMYVVLHELGHFACDEIGHTPKFWKIFKNILEEAIAIGLYQKEDFKAKPQPYCGIEITSSVV